MMVCCLMAARRQGTRTAIWGKNLGANPRFGGHESLRLAALTLTFNSIDP